MSITADRNTIENFLKTNLPQKSRVVADNQTGQAIGTDSLDKVIIILTDVEQNNFAIKYPDKPETVMSSGISVLNNIITIRIHINDEYVENTNGSWLFTSSLAHTILYMRDVSQYTQIAPPEIFNAYSQTIPISEVTSLLETGTRFGQISKE